MNKKILVFTTAIALAIGGIASIAIQSFAQNVATPTPTPTVTVTPSQENTSTDSDNVQNDNGGIDKPDAAVKPDTDKETNDDKGVVSGTDTKESGEKGTSNTTETEDGN